jgi:pimeloyl-ACP methyl ester carboxylesterase
MKTATLPKRKNGFPHLVCSFIVFMMYAHATALTTYPFDVKVIGEGTKSIVLMPGLSSSGNVWNETVNHYKKQYTCHVLTMHGFAGSTADSTSSFKNWETGIANYVLAFKLDHPIFIGHSIGGGMALLLAADYPTLFSKIIVVDALPCLGALSNPNFNVLPTPDCSMYVNQFNAMNDAQFYAMQQRTIPSLMNDTVHLEQVIQWSVKSNRTTIAEIYCQFLNTDLRTSLASIKCPALVLLETPFATMKSAIEEQYKLLKTAQFSYSNNALHFIMYDDQDWYFQQIDAFLK